MYADPNLNLFLEILRFTSFSLCIIFNVLLFWLIFKTDIRTLLLVCMISVIAYITYVTLANIRISLGHHKELGTYRFMLLAFVVADIFYGLVHFLTVPVPEVYKNAFVLGMHGWWSSRTAQSVWPIVYSLSFPLLSYNFIYRLIAVKYPFSIHIFTKPLVIITMILLTVAYAAIWAGVTRCCWFADEQGIEYTRDFFTAEHYPSYLTHDIKDVENYVIILYWNHGFLDGFNPQGFVGSAILGTMMLGAYKIMLCTSFLILRQIRSEPRLSDRSVRLNMQLFRALVLQAIIPMFTAYAPIAFCCFLPLIGLSIPVFSVLCPPFCALHPVLDSCILLGTVSQFRKTLVDLFFCRAGRRSSRVFALEYEMPEQLADIRLKRKLSDVYTAESNGPKNTIHPSHLPTAA